MANILLGFICNRYLLADLSHPDFFTTIGFHNEAY